MNSVFTAKLLQNLRNKKGNKGFTLIELLVVVIIIGVLAAVALPNLLGQVAKGRQAEAKNNLGAINRSQQAYRLEKGTFGTIGDGTNGTLPIRIQGEYYTYADAGTAGDAVLAVQNATSVGTYTNDINDYSAATVQTAAGAFSAIICETPNPTTALANSANTSDTASCGASMNKVN